MHDSEAEEGTSENHHFASRNHQPVRGQQPTGSGLRNNVPAAQSMARPTASSAQKQTEHSSSSRQKPQPNQPAPTVGGHRTGVFAPEALARVKRQMSKKSSEGAHDTVEEISSDEGFREHNRGHKSLAHKSVPPASVRTGGGSSRSSVSGAHGRSAQLRDQRTVSEYARANQPFGMSSDEKEEDDDEEEEYVPKKKGAAGKHKRGGRGASFDYDSSSESYSDISEDDDLMRGPAQRRPCAAKKGARSQTHNGRSVAKDKGMSGSEFLFFI
jgi:hypothetical protein